MDFGYQNVQGKSNSDLGHGIPMDSLGDVNMEVSISPEDVMRAGGLGATDSISSILPAVRDSTDFEDRLCEIRGYEDSDNNFSGPQSGHEKDILKADKFNVKDTDNVNRASESVNMEASVTSDEVIRAGGFGAKDDISSFLPVASDFTDFEANLRDARDYEDLPEQMSHPGLGWTGVTK